MNVPPFSPTSSLVRQEVLQVGRWCLEFGLHGRGALWRCCFSFNVEFMELLLDWLKASLLKILFIGGRCKVPHRSVKDMLLWRWAQQTRKSRPVDPVGSAKRTAELATRLG